ncbi:putative FAD-dependent monooxygenase [Phialemonium atrogriseum]|uniref:FAD-dependent monooxygenase n=1 Tax=Phialemonium atrogriseum TaxID=1093897 RepID=A0AAJ0BQB0_9PEZI|nr:putative FAD-dependent monooxygenase [Phialemonium atrogriseum]KAK1762504.1 putative FAD-dependent monooxygenase [Phialemonium atrogriseum]
MVNPPHQPVIVIGAGVSGLLLAQHLRERQIPFRVFERDLGHAYRGVGWGLSLHWSLPAVRSLLPEDLVRRLPEAYVDRLAVENGESSAFPFFDLASGELVAKTPKAPESDRIRVSRQRLLQILATGIDIQWRKAFTKYESTGDDSITASFSDGSSCVGTLLVACDGSNSRVRRQLFPNEHENRPLPVRLMGVKIDVSPEQIEPLRQLDPFFFQGASSENDSFMYFSILDAPANNDERSDMYTCQIVVSWPFRPGFLGNPSPTPVPPTNEGRLDLLCILAKTWAEPFQSLVLGIPPGTEVKTLDLADWPPPRGAHGTDRVVLMGDAFHTMTMYRGEGANHAILDVLDFADIVSPCLRGPEGNNTARGNSSTTDIDDKAEAIAIDGGAAGLRAALDGYEDAVIARARAGVLASRRACLDAHDWGKIGPGSPLLSRREPRLLFDEE